MYGERGNGHKGQTWIDPARAADAGRVVLQDLVEVANLRVMAVEEERLTIARAIPEYSA